MDTPIIQFLKHSLTVLHSTLSQYYPRKPVYYDFKLLSIHAKLLLECNNITDDVRAVALLIQSAYETNKLLLDYPEVAESVAAEWRRQVQVGLGVALETCHRVLYPPTLEEGGGSEEPPETPLPA